MFPIQNQIPKRPRLSVHLPERKPQHKHEICQKFQRGNCYYADRCRFIHNNADLTGFNRTVDENQNPRFVDKPKSCWKFMNGEKCKFGDKCNFNHIKSERNGEMLQQKQNLQWKTRLCNKWMLTGSCNYGFKCCFAHGESELQKQGFNDVQGYADEGPKWVDKTSYEKKVDELKWKNIKNGLISYVYADWINDTRLVHVENGDMAI